MLIAEEPFNAEDVELIIDIGTNGELILGNSRKLLSASCATGPALEGSQIKFGMPAGHGAIEQIKIDPDTRKIDYKVIGCNAWKTYANAKDMNVKGIC